MTTEAKPMASPRGRIRGQSLVEFALVLPVILLLLLVSLDFGRVFLGYINLQNMARVAANYAANNPGAWGADPDTAVQTKYRNQVIADAAATNCQLPVSGGTPVVPDPVFTDQTGNGETSNLGDNAQVQLTCTFDIITPIISSMLGDVLHVGAESNFPVKAGMSDIGGIVTGGNPVVPTAAFTGNGVVSERSTPYPLLSDVSPFSVEFRDTSGGGPNNWSWTFGDGDTSTLQDPLIHEFECSDPAPCSYRVAMTASNGNGSSIAYMDILVLPETTADFTASTNLVAAGGTVTFTASSTPPGANYEWTFGDGGTANGPSTSQAHVYAATGIYTVTVRITYDDGTEPVTVTKTDFVRVEANLCPVPDLEGKKFNDADAFFRGAPYNFTGNVTRDTGAPNGNFVITAQDLTATSLAPCSSSIKVTRP